MSGCDARVQKKKTHDKKKEKKKTARQEPTSPPTPPHDAPHQKNKKVNRRKRIARGSGTSVQEVNNLLRQYAQMRKMFKQMGKPSFARRLAGMKLPGM